jgi:hypothetical protein
MPERAPRITGARFTRKPRRLMRKGRFATCCCQFITLSRQRHRAVGDKNLASTPSTFSSERTGRRSSSEARCHRSCVKCFALSLSPYAPCCARSPRRCDDGHDDHAVAAWRQQRGTSGEAGLTPRKPDRKPKLSAQDRELLAVTKLNETLQRKLRIANALIALQKRRTSCWGWHSRSPRRRADAARRTARP